MNLRLAEVHFCVVCANTQAADIIASLIELADRQM
jgi:hypothetical protein